MDLPDLPDCCICLSEPTDPIQCQQCLGSSGTACRECFRDWARSLGSPKCPTCRNFFMPYLPPPEDTWGLMFQHMLYSLMLLGLSGMACGLPLLFTGGWFLAVWIWGTTLWYFWPMLRRWRFFRGFVSTLRQLSSTELHAVMGLEPDQPVLLDIDRIPGFGPNFRFMLEITGASQAFLAENGNLILPGFFVQKCCQELSTFQFGLTTGFRYQLIVFLALLGCICMKSYEFRYPSSNLDRAIDSIRSKRPQISEN